MRCKGAVHQQIVGWAEVWAAPRAIACLSEGRACPIVPHDCKDSCCGVHDQQANHSAVGQKQGHKAFQTINDNIAEALRCIPPCTRPCQCRSSSSRHQRGAPPGPWQAPSFPHSRPQKEEAAASAPGCQPRTGSQDCCSNCLDSCILVYHPLVQLSLQVQQALPLPSLQPRHRNARPPAASHSLSTS